MHKSFDKNSKSLKLNKGKSILKSVPKKVKSLDEDDIAKTNPLDKPKKKAPKKFYFDEDEDDVVYRIKT